MWLLGQADEGRTQGGTECTATMPAEKLLAHSREGKVKDATTVIDTMQAYTESFKDKFSSRLVVDSSGARQWSSGGGRSGESASDVRQVGGGGGNTGVEEESQRINFHCECKPAAATYRYDRAAPPPPALPPRQQSSSSSSNRHARLTRLVRSDAAGLFILRAD